MHAVADEHHRQVGQRHGALEAGRGQYVAAGLQRHRARAVPHGDRRRVRHRRGLQQRHALEPAAVARRFQPDTLHAHRDVAGGAIESR